MNRLDPTVGILGDSVVRQGVLWYHTASPLLGVIHIHIIHYMTWLPYRLPYRLPLLGVLRSPAPCLLGAGLASDLAQVLPVYNNTWAVANTRYAVSKSGQSKVQAGAATNCVEKSSSRKILTLSPPRYCQECARAHTPRRSRGLTLTNPILQPRA